MGRAGRRVRPRRIALVRRDRRRLPSRVRTSSTNLLLAGQTLFSFELMPSRCGRYIWRRFRPCFLSCPSAHRALIEASVRHRILLSVRKGLWARVGSRNNCGNYLRMRRSQARFSDPGVRNTRRSIERPLRYSLTQRSCTTN